VFLIYFFNVGKGTPPLIFANIPKITIDFFNNLPDTLDLGFGYNPNPKTSDWYNNNNLGENPENGYLKLEDSLFIIYYYPEVKSEALRTKDNAHKAIIPLIDLMGKYHYPYLVNNRKLPIYVPKDCKSYNATISNIQKNKLVEYCDGALGIYLFEVSKMGTLAKGIVLNPIIFNDLLTEKVTLWHEMNHYVYFNEFRFDSINEPAVWVFEGLAEYFANNKERLSDVDTTKLDKIHLNKQFNFDDNYWVGYTAYKAMEKKYNRTKLKKYIQLIYSKAPENAIKEIYGIFISDFEEYWKKDAKELFIQYINNHEK